MVALSQFRFRCKRHLTNNCSGSNFAALNLPAELGVITQGGASMKQAGSCLCGGVQYEINGPLTDVLNCHCSMCRKLHASAFRTRAKVQSSDWNTIKGQELLKFYESSPGEHKGFCSNCGSSLYTKFDAAPRFMVSHSEHSIPTRESKPSAMYSWAVKLPGSRLRTICLRMLSMTEAVITSRVRRTAFSRRFAQR